MIAGFISAIIKFGHEIIARPQRIDFGDIAMSFFPLKMRDRIFWFTILSDALDPRQATINFLKNFVHEAEELLLEASAVEGFSILSEDIEKKLNGIVNKIIRKSTRILPEIRSDDKKVLPVSIPLTFVFAMIINGLFLYIYANIPPGELFLITPAMLAQYCLIGIISGIISGRAKAGGISAYIGSTIATAMTSRPSLVEMLVLASSLSVWSGIIGLFMGLFVNSKKLTFIPK